MQRDHFKIETHGAINWRCSAGAGNTNEDETHQLLWKHTNTSWPYIRKKDCWDSNVETDNKELFWKNTRFFYRII